TAIALAALTDDGDGVPGGRAANAVGHGTESRGAEPRLDGLDIGLANLNDGAKLFAEQRGDGIGPKGTDVNVEPAVTGKCHLRKRREKAAVRSIVVRDDQPILQATLNDGEERGEPLGI